MFDHKKIKFIRKLPEGNDILLCWIMLLASAGKCNMGGYIFLTSDIAYTAEMLADEFDMPINTIRLALDTFSRLSMINQDNGIYIEGWEEYQNIDGMEKIRLQNRKRAKKRYDNKKASLLLEDSHVSSHVRITQPHATDIDIELDLELELEREKEKDLKNNNTIILSSEQPVKSEKPKKHKYGEYGHILLTERELGQLRDDYGGNVEELIKYLDEYIEMKGLKYKSHYLAIRKWVVTAVSEQKKKKNKGTVETNNVFNQVGKDRGYW
jgi:predicted phage replisome organizer